jgi:multisubunit Na+/H+ antiporter MnhF subunit
MSSADSPVLRTPVPGPMFAWVKRASYFELALFAALIVVWVAPGLEPETAALGLAHGLGFVALAILIWIAVIRHEAPYTLLAATLTPVGPVGSVIAIRYIERKPAEGEEEKGGGTAKGVTRPAP